MSQLSFGDVELGDRHAGIGLREDMREDMRDLRLGES